MGDDQSALLSWEASAVPTELTLKNKACRLMEHLQLCPTMAHVLCLLGGGLSNRQIV